MLATIRLLLVVARLLVIVEAKLELLPKAAASSCNVSSAPGALLINAAILAAMLVSTYPRIPILAAFTVVLIFACVTIDDHPIISLTVNTTLPVRPATAVTLLDSALTLLVIF